MEHIWRQTISVSPDAWYIRCFYSCHSFLCHHIGQLCEAPIAFRLSSDFSSPLLDGRWTTTYFVPNTMKASLPVRVGFHPKHSHPLLRWLSRDRFAPTRTEQVLGEIDKIRCTWIFTDTIRYTSGTICTESTTKVKHSRCRFQIYM